MSLVAQQRLRPSGVGLYGCSGPACVVFNNELYTFYSGAGNDGPWYTVLSSLKGSWSDLVQCTARGARGVCIAIHSTPCPIVFKNKLFVFYNGSGHDGTWWIESADGRTWSNAQSVRQKMNASSETFEPNTSPSAVVLGDRLYLFWKNANNTYKARYTWLDATDTNNAFAKPLDVTSNGMGVRERTSVAAVVFQNKLYLFFNGTGQNGTFKTSFIRNNSWTDTVGVNSLEGSNYLDGSSPAVFVSENGALMTLLWVGPNDSGVFYSQTFDGSNWTSQTSVKRVIGDQGLWLASSPCGVDYNSTPYIFWSGTEKALWFTRGLVFSADVGNDECSLAIQAAREGKSFTMTSNSKNVVDCFSYSRFPNGLRIAPEQTCPAIPQQTSPATAQQTSSAITQQTSLAITALLASSLGYLAQSTLEQYARQQWSARVFPLLTKLLSTIVWAVGAAYVVTITFVRGILYIQFDLNDAFRGIDL